MPRYMGAAGDNRMSQFPDNRKGDRAVWNPDPNLLLLVLHHSRDLSRSKEDKRERPWKQAFHGSVSVVGDYGILAYVGQVVADYAYRLFWGKVFLLPYLINSLFSEYA